MHLKLELAEFQSFGVAVYNDCTLIVENSGIF